MNNAVTKAITEASAPSNRADADVILRSSNNVDFKVFKTLLSMGSPFFDDMISLPQSPATTADDVSETKGGLPLIRVTETAHVLATLLAMCYPMHMEAVEQQPLDTLEKVDMLLDAAVKYNVEKVEKFCVCVSLSLTLARKPTPRFTIACRRGMDIEAMIAGRVSMWGSITKSQRTVELQSLSATNLLNLPEYHHDCITARTSCHHR